jgi:hypothetical protein
MKHSRIEVIKNKSWNCSRALELPSNWGKWHRWWAMWWRKEGSIAVRTKEWKIKDWLSRLRMWRKIRRDWRKRLWALSRGSSCFIVSRYCYRILCMICLLRKHWKYWKTKMTFNLKTGYLVMRTSGIWLNLVLTTWSSKGKTENPLRK